MPLGTEWLLCDTRSAAHSPVIIWGQPHAPLYAATILTRDQSLANRCLHCLEPDHSTAACALCPQQKQASCRTAKPLAKAGDFLREETESTAQRFRKNRFAGGSTGVTVTEMVSHEGMFGCAAAVRVTGSTHALTRPKRRRQVKSRTISRKTRHK